MPLRQFLSVQLGAYEYLEARFLAVVQSLESLHRCTANHTVMNDDEFIDITNKLIEQCPEHRKKWLRGRLEFANEIPLRKRIKSLMRPFRSYFGNNESRESLIDNIVNTRNWLTHFDPDSRERALDGIDLVYAFKKMQGLAILCFLRELGFDKAEIRDTVRRLPDLRHQLVVE